MKNHLTRTRALLIITISLIMILHACVIHAQDVALTKENIQTAMDEAYTKFKDVKEGKNADYIKELATVDPDIFGIAIVMTDGQVFTRGDIDSKVSIQSVSKVFTLAQDIEELGHQAIQDNIGVDATGEVFNSIVAIEKKRGKKINPLVNPGAIAATSLIAGADSAAKWKRQPCNREESGDS